MSSHQVHELGLRTEPQASPFSARSFIIFDRRVLSLDQLVWVSLMILVNHCSSCKIIDNVLNLQSFMCEHFGTLSACRQQDCICGGPVGLLKTERTESRCALSMLCLRNRTLDPLRCPRLRKTSQVAHRSSKTATGQYLDGLGTVEYILL